MSIQGKQYTFVIVKNPKQGFNEEPYLFFISDLQVALSIANHYLKRWKIEYCFKHLKQNGFNIEDINLKDDHKIELMMGLLTYTYLMAIMEGVIKQSVRTSNKKKYKNGRCYPSISIFRLGYIELQHICINIFALLKYLKKLLSPILSRDTAITLLKNV